MKEETENRFRIMLPRRAYTLIRIDGKAFHSYTKGLKRPFDDGLIDDMDATAKYLCENISGARFAFIQSDEITILITDFDNETTQAWFDNNLQKMCSISASMATAKFNHLRMMRKSHSFSTLGYGVGFSIGATTEKIKTDIRDIELANFDSRVWQIPSRIEVFNAFVWRQQDATRNSIQSVAQSLYTHQELNGKNTNELQEMIFQKGINWNDYASKYKRGRIISREDDFKVICDMSEVNAWKRAQVMIKSGAWFTNNDKNFCIQTKAWKNVEVPIFTQDRDFLDQRIPRNNDDIVTNQNK